MFYHNNLYEMVFGFYAKKYNQLDIISGYGSSKFLKRVLSDFPKLSIRLFLGMSSQGITRDNHDMYRKLMLEYPDRVAIFYQITLPATHIKLFKWFDEVNKINLVGSANFSEMAFIGEQQNEILVTTEEDLDELILLQERNSISCLENVESFIMIYDKEREFIEKQQNTLLDSVEIDIKKTEILIEQYEILDKYYWNEDYFAVPVILKSDVSVTSKGINGWNGPKKISYLEQAPSWYFRNAFPTEKSFEIIFDDKTYVARLSDDYRELQFINGEFNRMINQKLKKPVNHIITYSDLWNYGNVFLIFKKMSDRKFIMSYPPGNRRLKNVKNS